MGISGTARAALLVVPIALGNSGLACLAFAESFDKPIRETIVDLGPSPYLLPGNRPVQLFCSYFADFVVKQLNDPGQKGTRWVTIAPILNGQAPPCHRWHDSTERFLAKEWWTFIGARRSLLFLEAADGDSNGGMPFRVLDSRTGKKIFEDSEWWNGHLEFLPNSDGAVPFRYLRVVGGDCSIAKEGRSCWNRFRRHYSLTSARVPKCTGYRVEGDREWVVADEGVPPEPIETPSAIAYPVEVKLFPLPSIGAIPGPVKCTPVQ
jgi:hypothetical protein